MGWVYTPNLVSSLAMAASRLVSDSPAWTSAPSVMSSGKNIASESSRQESQRVTWTTLPFGTTSQPSTGNHGVDTWILLLEVSRANPTPSRARDEAKLMNVISGRTPLESFGMWDQAGCCWRTYQASLLTGTAEPLWGSFPKSGMTVSGTAYRLRPLVPRISGGGGGVWPTPNSNPSHRTLTEGQSIDGQGRRWGLSLEQAAKLWPTPRAVEGEKANQYYGGGNLTLTGAVKKWPTPQSSDAHPAVLNRNHQARIEGPKQTQLPDAVGGLLNPTWVEWLMGLPLGWTALEPLETASYQQWARSFSMAPHD